MRFRPIVALRLSLTLRLCRVISGPLQSTDVQDFGIDLATIRNNLDSPSIQALSTVCSNAYR